MMSKDKNATSAPVSPFGDVNVIRDILMGQHISQFEHRFQENEETIARTEEALRNRIQQMENEMNARFERLEQLLSAHVETLTNRLMETSKGDKASLARLLDEVSNKLKEG